MLCLLVLAAGAVPPEKLSSREVELQHKESGERLSAAAAKLYETHKMATLKCGEAAVPVLKDTIQDLFPSPSPPPPPFTASGFGMDMITSALTLDASKGSKTLNGGAKVGMQMGMAKAEADHSLAGSAAVFASHTIIGPSPPPAFPNTKSNAEAHKAVCEAALADSKEARKAYELAAKEHAAATATLVKVKTGLALTAEPAASRSSLLQPVGLAALGAAALAVALWRANKGRSGIEDPHIPLV